MSFTGIKSKTISKNNRIKDKKRGKPEKQNYKNKTIKTKYRLNDTLESNT